MNIKRYIFPVILAIFYSTSAIADCDNVRNTENNAERCIVDNSRSETNNSANNSRNNNTNINEINIDNSNNKKEVNIKNNIVGVIVSQRPIFN